jgi:hypothetical protein
MEEPREVNPGPFVLCVPGLRQSSRGLNVKVRSPSPIPTRATARPNIAAVSIPVKGRSSTELVGAVVITVPSMDEPEVVETVVIVVPATLDSVVGSVVVVVVVVVVSDESVEVDELVAVVSLTDESVEVGEVVGVVSVDVEELLDDVVPWSPARAVPPNITMTAHATIVAVRNASSRRASHLPPSTGVLMIPIPLFANGIGRSHHWLFRTEVTVLQVRLPSLPIRPCTRDHSTSSAAKMRPHPGRVHRFRGLVGQ